MPQVQFAANFFKKERDTNYSYWQLAVFRELFQNAIDQAASKITIDLTQAGDNVALMFADNGPGMTRQVLNDVYFRIGASTKDGDDSKIGGMGRARVLTCFAMDAYQILSQDYHVVGHGGSYDVFDHAWTAGCRLAIMVNDTSLIDMNAALTQFLAESNINAEIVVNGQSVTTGAAHGVHVRNLIARDVEFAKVYVNKDVESKCLIVRVNGVSMFTDTVSADVAAQVIVELEPSLSRTVLTANRDGLHYWYRSALNSFMREMAVDTTSALRQRIAQQTKIVHGGGMKIARKTTKKDKKADRTNVAVQSAALHDQSEGRRIEPKEVISSTKVADDFSWLRETFGDIYLFDETEKPEMRKVVGQYHPDAWKTVYVTPGGRVRKAQIIDGEVVWPVQRAPRPYRKGGNIIRVLLLWHTAVSYALEVSMDALNMDALSFAVGFLFPNDSRGAEHRVQDDGHVFALRPVDDQGKLRFSITSRTDLKRLMAYAKHEVTHIDCAWHGESFSTFRETVDVVFDEAECFRRMKQALRNAVI